MRVFEIPNFTVKNGCFDICWSIIVNNSVTEECGMCEVCLH